MRRSLPNAGVWMKEYAEAVAVDHAWKLMVFAGDLFDARLAGQTSRDRIPFQYKEQTPGSISMKPGVLIGR
jgi:hypothetical protein